MKEFEITKPSITRLARQAGVKNVADDCYDYVRDMISQEISEIIHASLVVNTEKQTKTLMPSDVYEALEFLGHNVAQSNELSTSTFSK